MNKNKSNSTCDTICATCLTQDRKLYPARDSDHFATCFPDLSLSENDEVCWECCHMVEKMAAFRSRVLRARAMLSDLLSGKLLDIKSLSSLSSSEPSIDIDIADNELKLELELFKEEIDTSTFEVEIKCEDSGHMGDEEMDPNNTPTLIPITCVQNQLKMSETEDTNSNSYSISSERNTNRELLVSHVKNQKETDLSKVFNDFIPSEYPLMPAEEILAYRKNKEKIECESETSNSLQHEKCIEPFENLTSYNNHKEIPTKTLRPHTSNAATSKRASKKGPTKRPASPNQEPSRSRPKLVSPKPGPSDTQRVAIGFQIEETGDSGSDSDAQSSGDEASACVADMRLFAKKLRELRILREEGSGRAVEEFLQEAGAAENDGFGDVEETQQMEETLGESSGSSSFCWSEDFSSYSGKQEEYKRKPGPKITCTDPLDIFLTIWDDTFLRKTAEQMNKYAWEVIVSLTERKTLPKYLDHWVETTVEEVRRFLGVLVFMSLSSKARVDEYWSTGILGMERFRALMARNRFRLLWRFLCFADSEQVATIRSTYEKRIGNIAPVIEHLNGKFSSIYTPERALSLDECLLMWKRLSWQQCIRSKTARFGVKSVELCEASSGYLLRCMLYAGNSSFAQKSQFENKTAKIDEMMDGFLDIGHLVVMDNWSNQLQLARFLKNRGTDVLGTMHRNRAFVPKELKHADPKRMRRGEQISRHCGDISITTWKDVKLITIVSTTHKNEQITSCYRGHTLPRPAALQDYNKIMCGVDLKYSKLSEYEIQHKKGHKWYKKVFLHLFNTSILNAYVIYQRNSAVPLSHRAFRYKLAEGLVAEASPVPVSRMTIPPPCNLRLDGRDHYPTMTEEVIGKKVKHSRRRCMRCKAQGKRAQVNVMCKKCDVALCIGKCFIDYHTLKHLT